MVSAALTLIWYSFGPKRHKGDCLLVFVPRRFWMVFMVFLNLPYTNKLPQSTSISHRCWLSGTTITNQTSGLLVETRCAHGFALVWQPTQPGAVWHKKNYGNLVYLQWVLLEMWYTKMINSCKFNNTMIIVNIIKLDLWVPYFQTNPNRNNTRNMG